MNYREFYPRRRIDLASKDSVLLKYIPDIEKAVEVLSKDSTLIWKNLSNNNSEILAIGFPEIIRWNEFQDVVETASDQLLYVRSTKESQIFTKP